MRKIYWALIFIGIGIWILLSNYHLIAFNFSRDWPVLLIALGIAEIIDAAVSVGKKNKRAHAANKNNIKNILDSLEQGKIDVNEAEERIKGGSNG